MRGSSLKGPSNFKISGPPKYMAKKRLPPTIKKAEPVVSRENAGSGWNNSNVPESRFFDKSQDKDYMRKTRE